MKKLFTLFVAVLLTASVLAQSPEKMSYQAVIRNSSDVLVTDTQIGMQISILQGTANGSPVYVETQTPTTNANGLVSVEIGTGTTSDDFSSIDWANGPYFIKTETDPAGGTSYIITGTSQLLSVPYALHAKSAETVTESDPLFTSWDKSTGVSVTESQISDLTHFTTSDETDPVFMAWDKDYNDLTNTPVTITASQADAIAANSAKVGYTDALVSANADVVANTAKVGYTDALVSSNANVVANTAKVGVSPGTAAGQIQYWDGTAWVTVAVTENEGAALQMIGGVPTWVGGTPSTPNVTNPTTGAIWMDRNLGATQVATSSTDYLAYGDLYQWGRASDGHQTIVWTSSTTSDGAEQANETTTLSSTDDPGHGDFILASDDPNDWRSPQNDNLWQGVSGTNNPCPSGYRLPTIAEWEAERQSWSSNDAAGAFASPLKLPMAGSRGDSNGSLLGVGSFGGFWSSTVDGTYSRYLDFYSSTAVMVSLNRALGFSVRCLKDGTPPLSLPTITTSSVTDIAETSTTVGGEVTDDGGSTVSERGVYYSTSASAETTGTKLAIGSGTGVFSTSLTGLTEATTYYIKAYATNSEGTAYGTEDSFTTAPTLAAGEVYNPVTGEIWMDRNLGASQAATSSTDYLAYGDLYQWGRASDGHQTIVWTSSTTSDGAEQANESATLSSTDDPGHGDFILAPDSPYDWRSPQNDNLWQGLSGTNNPCPSGYRLPTEAEWEAERQSWGSNNSAGAFASPLKLPMAGYRSGSGGSLGSVGSGGGYWSSTVDGTGSRGLYFGGGSAGMYSDGRAYGSSLRCLKD